MVDPSGPVVLKAKGTAAVAVYGRSYPEDAAYAGTGVPVQGSNSASLTKYTIPADQAYVAAGAPVAGDYYYGGTTLGTLVKGTQTFYPIRYNHRIAWVRTADVQQVTPALLDPRGQPLRPAGAGRQRWPVAVPGFGRHHTALSDPVQDR